MLYTDMLQLSSKVTFTRVASEMCAGRIYSHASGTRTRRVRASAKPHNKTAARLTWLPHPFFKCTTHPERVRYMSVMHAGHVWIAARHVWDACKRYHRAELYLWNYKINISCYIPRNANLQQVKHVIIKVIISQLTWRKVWLPTDW